MENPALWLPVSASHQEPSVNGNLCRTCSFFQEPLSPAGSVLGTPPSQRLSCQGALKGKDDSESLVKDPGYLIWFCLSKNSHETQQSMGHKRRKLPWGSKSSWATSTLIIGMSRNYKIHHKIWFKLGLLFWKSSCLTDSIHLSQQFAQLGKKFQFVCCKS